MHLPYFLLTPCLFGAAINAANIEQRAPPQHLLRWVCTGADSDDIPDVCNNMCYGANCKRLGSTFTWDRPDDNTKSRRARGAGCGTAHTCGSHEQCDEYPFGSTIESEQVMAVSRCVPREQNARQGAALKQFYNSQGSFDDTGLNGVVGTQFSISFANEGGIRYCVATRNCANDGEQYNRNGLARRDHSDSRKRQDTVGGHYKLSSGQTLYAPDGASVGDIVWTPRSINKTLHMEMTRDHVFDPDQGLEQYDYMQHNMASDRDEVVGPADE